MHCRSRVSWSLKGVVVAVLLGVCCTQATDTVPAFFGQGDLLADGWRIERSERHPEFIRLWLSREGKRTGIEITYARNQDRWSSEHYLVQPAPGEQPPRQLLESVLERLRRIDRDGHVALVRRLDRDITAAPARPLPDLTDKQLVRLPVGRWLQLLNLGASAVLSQRGQTPPRQRQMRVPPWSGWEGWGYLAVFLVVMLLGWILLSFRLTAAVCSSCRRFLDKNWLWVLLLLLVPLAALRLLHLNLPFDGDYMTQRVFFGSMDIGDILLHRYSDQRHPQLFYLILHFFLYLGHREWLVRLPAVLFSLTALVSLFVLARRFVGNSGGLLSVLLLGISFPFLHHSCDVSDITLFVTLVLLSCHLLLNYVEKPVPARLLLFAVVETCMFYTYHFAVLVLAAQVMTMLLHARSRPWRSLWLALAASMVLALPAFSDLLTVILSDIQTRQLAHLFPHHIWGENSPWKFLQQFASLLIPADMLGRPLLVAASLVGVVRFARVAWRRPGFTLLMALLGVSLVVVALSVVLVRIMPYYLLFLLPLFLFLLVFGSLGGVQEGGTSAARRAVGWGLVALAVFSYGRQTYRQAPRLFDPAQHDQYARMGHLLRDSKGPYTVVADPDMLHTIILYYCFPRPLEMYRTCRYAEQPVHCQLDGWRLVTLTNMTGMKRGWEEAALGRLKRLDAENFWFVYHRGFSNQPLLEYLTHNCNQRGAFERLLVFRCLTEKSVVDR